MNKVYTIGQLATLFGINIQTLYFYDRIGLFSPDNRNEKTNVRQYAFDQIYELSTILYLRKLGLSLEEIKDSLRTLTPETAQKKLTERSNELKKNWDEITKIDNAIHRKLEYVEREKSLVNETIYKVIHKDERKYLDMGGESIVYSSDAFYFYPTIAIYENDSKTFGALLEKNEALAEDEADIIIIPKGYFFTDYHYGSYDGIGKHIEDIKNTYPSLKFSSKTYTFNIIDQFNSSDIEKYLTRLELQVLD